MPIATVNARFVTQREWEEAARGMNHLVDVKVLPAMEIYRFASVARRHRWYAASWWFGTSAYDALVRSAGSSRESLSDVARRCLAVPEEWSTMDVLIAVRVLKPLSAWSGTPKTVRLKDEKGSYAGRLEPERSITQLYIPGLDPTKNQGKCVAWADAFAGAPRFVPKGA